MDEIAAAAVEGLTLPPAPEPVPERAEAASPETMAFLSGHVAAPAEGEVANLPAKIGPGRPTDYTEEKAALVCDLIASGLTMSRIENTEGLPCERTIFRWLRTHDDFAEQYRLALIWRTHARGDQIIDIVDDTRQDWVERPAEDGGAPIKEPNKSLEWRVKLQVSSRFKLMAQENAKVYGEQPKALPVPAADAAPPGYRTLPGDDAKPVLARLIDLHPMDHQLRGTEEALKRR